MGTSKTFTVTLGGAGIALPSPGLLDAAGWASRHNAVLTQISQSARKKVQPLQDETKRKKRIGDLSTAEKAALDADEQQGITDILTQCIYAEMPAVIPAVLDFSPALAERRAAIMDDATLSEFVEAFSTMMVHARIFTKPEATSEADSPDTSGDAPASAKVETLPSNASATS